MDPLCVVAPRAKAVVIREHMRRRGSAMLRGARSAITGDLLDNEGRAGEDGLIRAARAGLDAEEARLRAALDEQAEAERRDRERNERELAARVARREAARR